MKHAKTVASLAFGTLIAGALCTTLLTGCGSTAQSAATSQAADAPADTMSMSTVTNADDADQGLNDIEATSGYPSLSSFRAQTIDGKDFTQADLAKTDVTVINFWSPFCGYCIEEIPQIAAWEKTLPKNVQLITVCTDYDSDPVSSEEILRECGFEGTTLVAGSGDYQGLLDEVAFLPTTLVVDSSGKVVGNALEGMAEDVAQTFGQMVNEALQAQGKASINA